MPNLESEEYPRRSDDDRLTRDDLREILIVLQAAFESSGDFLFMSGALYIDNHQRSMWLN